MAATGYTPISLYYSTTASAVPTAGNLANGELALNIADMKLYAKNGSGVVTLLASSSGATGTVSSVAVSGGTTGLTTSGGPITSSGTITLAGTLATTNGGTGLTSFTANGVVYASSTSALTTGSALQFDGTNLGLGVTPSAWSGFKAFDVNTYGCIAATTSEVDIVGNAYNNGTNWIAKATGVGTRYLQTAGTHYFQNAASVTGGSALTFVNAMTLDSSGNLGLGVTPSAWGFGGNLELAGSNNIAFQNTGNILSNSFYSVSAGSYVYKITAGSTRYQLTNTEHRWYNAASGTAGNAISFTQAMTLDASGRLGIGSTSPNAPLTFANAVGKKINFYESSDYSIGVESSELRIATGATSGGAGAGITFYTGGYSGTERFRIAANGAWGLAGANYGTSGQVLTSNGSGSAPTWAAASGGASKGQAIVLSMVFGI